MDYPNAKFLIYNSWEIDEPYKLAGSLIVGIAFTEGEAKEKIELYKGQSGDFHSRFPSNTRRRFTYIANRPEWWTNYKPSVQ